MKSRAQEQGLSAASSMGLLGSTPALQAIQAGRSQISNADKHQYLSDLMESIYMVLNWLVVFTGGLGAAG